MFTQVSIGLMFSITIKFKKSTDKSENSHSYLASSLSTRKQPFGNLE